MLNLKKGFTLLEVMITLVFFTSAISAIFTILTTSQRQTDHFLFKREAIDLAASRLEVEAFNGPLLEEVSANNYEITVLSDPLFPGPDELCKTITVNVTWSDRFKSNSQVSLKKIIYNPKYL
jgi:type II secretory pathway pseudopilin PulG